MHVPRHGDDALRAAPDDPYEETGVKLGDYQFERAAALGGGGPARARRDRRRARAPPTSSPATPPTSSSPRSTRSAIRDGANLVVEGYDFAPTFSIWTTIEECLNPPVIWERDRGWFTTAPFSEPEVFDFPEGIGPVECVNVEHEEVLLVPRWIDCSRVTFKYGLGDEFIDVLKTLHKLGLDSKEPIAVRASRSRRATSSPPRSPTRRRSATACAARRAPARSSPGTGKDGAAAEDLPLPRRRQRDGRCASTARRRSSGRRRSTRSIALELLASGDVEGRRRPRPGGVPAAAVPRASSPSTARRTASSSSSRDSQLSMSSAFVRRLTQ